MTASKGILPRPKRNGAPSKLTPEIQEQIVKAISIGAYIETAAAYAGITKDTLYKWLKRGAKQRSGPYKNFSDAVGKAIAVAEMRDVQRIDKAGETQWQAVAWRLERKHPKKWGRKEIMRLETEDTKDSSFREPQDLHQAIVSIVERAEEEAKAFDEQDLLAQVKDDVTPGEE